MTEPNTDKKEPSLTEIVPQQIDRLEPMLRQLCKQLKQRNPLFNPKEFIEEIITSFNTNLSKGLWLIESSEVIGAIWVNALADNYGVICGYIPKHYAASVFFQTILKPEYVPKEMVIQIGGFFNPKEQALAKNLLKQNGYELNKRQRLHLLLAKAKFTAKADALAQLRFHPLTQATLSETQLLSISNVCVKAHQHAKDLPHYAEFHSVEENVKRLKKLLSCQKSPIIEKASFCIYKNDLNNVEQLIGGIMCFEASGFQNFDRIAWLLDVFLEPSMHGNGYGKAVIEKSLKMLKNMGYQLLILTVSDSNNPAKNMYHKMGFRKLCEIEEFGLPFQN